MDDLTAALTATGATLAFDATGGGTLASQILTCMEAAASASRGGYSRYGSAVHKQVYIYGGLDRSPTVLTGNFGMAWGIGGWLLTPFLQDRPGGHHPAAGPGRGRADNDVRQQLHRAGVAARSAPPRSDRREWRQADGLKKYVITRVGAA